MPVGGYVGRTEGTAGYAPLYGTLTTDLWDSLGGFHVPVAEPAWEAFEKRIRRRMLARPHRYMTHRTPPARCRG